MYKALTLGEIISRRTWAAGGELNGLALKRQTAQSSSALKVVGDELHTVEEKEWEPKSMLTVIDGAEAARWAWILLQLGLEDEVNAYCTWFVSKVRSQGADKLHQMQQFWLQSAWRIAMGMRSGRTFGEITQQIRSDLPALQERWRCRPRRRGRSPKRRPMGNPGTPRKWARTDEGDQVKGRGREDRKDKGRRAATQGNDSQEYWGDWTWAQSSWSQDQTANKQWSWDNAKKTTGQAKARSARDSAGPRQRRTSQAGDPTTRPRGRDTPRPPCNSQAAEPKGSNIILLTAFDGIRAAPYLLEQRFGRPRFAVAWEIDQDFLAYWTGRGPQRSERTALRGVHRLHGGGLQGTA